MRNNPQAFRGAAPYYAIGRPPYSPALRETLARVLSLDGTGRLLDVGCGPGLLAIELAPLFSEVIGLDPEPGMLAEGRRRAEEAGLGQMQWVEAVAEDIPELQLEPCRVVTFGQSFHRVDRFPVTEAVYDLLEPGGAIALVSHSVQDRPRPSGPDLPAIPHDEVRALIAEYLGADRVPAAAPPEPDDERWEKSLEKTRFGAPRIVHAPGRPDYVRDVDSVVANYYSMSYATPPLFGDSKEQYESDLRALLARHSPRGLFWDWPGDTEIAYAVKH